MYCEKCGALIPTGLKECPNCLHAKEKWIGEIFEFHFESGLSSTSKSEIDHTVLLQKYEMIITGQKSLTVMKRKSKPAITQAVRYQDILSIQEKNGLALGELPLIVFFALLVFFCPLPYNVIFLHFIYYYAESFLLYLLQFIYFMPRRYPILQPFNKK